MTRFAALLLVCAAGALALLACSGSCSQIRGCAYQRSEPSAAQSGGIHGASIARRLPILRRRAGSNIEGLLVNRWGELWTERDGSRIAIAHDGARVKETDSVHETVSTDDPFPVRDIDPNAVDRALKRIAAVNPGRSFVKASLTRNDFLQGGLQWEIQVASKGYYATYDAAPDGSSVCLTVTYDHGKTPPVHRCPKFGHQPEGIPAPD
jgi:hypothetical protein